MTAAQQTLSVPALSAPVLSPEEELYWLALHLLPGLGPRKSQQLLAKLRSPQAIFRCSKSELEAYGVNGSVAQSIASGVSFEEAAAQHDKMRQTGTKLVTATSPAYPARLRDIFDPPVALFVQGRVELLNEVGIGVVGTRRPSAYGLAAAERISRELAEAGLSIVSGMARGIDTKAHTAALEAGGMTVAVFGCGIDVIYPAENRRLAERLATQGLLVSEFPMGAPGYPQNFPIRNRIISGVSAGVLIVEGAQYSGSTITAKLAADQGREVFAIPGNITAAMSWAPNLLIKQGAKLVQEWNDVVAELPDVDREKLARRQRQRLLEFENSQGEPVQQVAAPDRPSAPLESAVMKLLQFDKGLHLDHLMEVLEGQTSSELIAALFDLELRGLVRQLPGRNYIKVWVE